MRRLPSKYQKCLKILFVGAFCLVAGFLIFHLVRENYIVKGDYVSVRPKRYVLIIKSTPMPTAAQYGSSKSSSKSREHSSLPTTATYESKKSRVQLLLPIAATYTIKSIKLKEQRENAAKVLASRLCRNHFETVLSLLDDVAATLQAAGVTFFISDGALIGSWRHHGLIPWDDDIDFWFDSAQNSRAQDAFRRVPNSKIHINSGDFVKLIRDVPGYWRPNNFSQTLNTKPIRVSNNSETSTPSEFPMPFEQLPRYGPEFWPDGECPRPHAEVDLFRFDNTSTGIRTTTIYHIAIPHDAVFPLVLHPFERRISRVLVASVASGTRTNSSLSLQSTSRVPIVDLETWNAAPYRLLPAPRDPLRVLAPIYQKVEERCANIAHWRGYGVHRFILFLERRPGWEVSCDELKPFVPFVWHVENATHYIELLRNRDTLISEFALPKTR